MWVKCSKCGVWSDYKVCFWCSGEKSKTAFRRKYWMAKKPAQQKEANNKTGV